jgi:drug/metabolite transporter (DMT)-like permease
VPLTAPPPTLTRTLLLAALAVLAFASNSLLCRLALKSASIDAATFTAVRLLSGAVVLALVVRLRRRAFSRSGDWASALALLVYAAGFSWAYLQLTATGALLLFGAVQLTMVAWGLLRGERLRALQWSGLLAACAGLVAMLLPGLAAPPLLACLLMLCAGAAWGVYSLRGRGQADATAVTAGNFWRASVLALRGLTSTRAAAIQLTVPALAALGAVAFLGEPITLRLSLASLVILGGVALVIAGKH